MDLGSTKDWSNSLGMTSQEKARLLATHIEEVPEVDDDVEPILSEDTYDGEQLRTLAKEDLDTLAGLAVPHVFKFLYPPSFIAMWQLLQQYIVQKPEFPQIALGIPRGFGKTTLIKLNILYNILYTDSKFILVMSSTTALAQNILSDVVDMLNERNIVNLFGNWQLGLEKDTQELKKFGFRGRTIILAAIGAEGSVRGLNLKNERPDVMIFDDIQTKECSESKVQSDALERWMIGTAMKAKSPSGCMFIFAGNMYPGPNSILKKLKTNPSWIKFISGAILQGGSSLWEELRSKKSLIAELNNDIAMGHPEIFFSEVLNDTEAGINTDTDIAAIRDWPYTDMDLPQGKAIIIDPSNDKVNSDKVSIGLMEVYDGTPAMRTIIEGRFSPGNTIRKALVLALTSGCRLIAVESTGYQYSLLYWFETICKELSITGITCVDVYPGMNSKNSRIASTLKSLTAGELLLHPDCKALVVNEIINWNPMKRDNIDNNLDLLTYMQKVLEDFGPMMHTSTSLELLEAGGATVQEENHAF